MVQVAGEAWGAGRFTFSYGSSSHIGLVRELNEDAILTAPPVFAVADGMGGHDGGEIASAIAVEELRRLQGCTSLSPGRIQRALDAAGERIRGLERGAGLAAGTTVSCVAATVIGHCDYWLVVNIGDSRIYRCAKDTFEQISVDHSVVQELVDGGKLSPEDARTHPYRHAITRSLGSGGSGEPDFWFVPIAAGDRMLVCSDGPTEDVDDAEIAHILRQATSPNEACSCLIQSALRSGGHDNVSAVVIEATPASKSG